MSLFLEALLGFLVFVINDVVLEIKEADVPDLKSPRDLLTVLHWTKVDGLQRSDLILTEDCGHIHVDRNILVNVLALSFQDVEKEV